MADPKAPADAPEVARDQTFKRDLIALIPHLRAFARSLAPGAVAADDLAQDAMLRAWNGRAGFQAGTNMKAWTFMILRNQFFSDRRRAWRETSLDQETAEQTLVAVDDPAAVLALDELRQGLAMLPPKQREALVLVGAGGFSYDEAATICRCAPGTMKSRVSRGRMVLQTLLERGAYDRDGAAAGQAMGAIQADVARLSAGKPASPLRRKTPAALQQGSKS